MSEILIRDANHSSDLESITSLFKKFRADWNPASDLRNKIEKYPAIVACYKGDIIGFAYCFSFAPDMLELANIYVEESFRSNSVGSRILENIEKRSKTLQYKGLILTNSDAYKTKQLKYSASNFYLRNRYKEIARTDITRVFYKCL